MGLLAVETPNQAVSTASFKYLYVDEESELEREITNNVMYDDCDAYDIRGIRDNHWRAQQKSQKKDLQGIFNPFHLRHFLWRPIGSIIIILSHGNALYLMTISTHISHSDHCISSLSPVFYIFLIYYYGLINLVPRQHVCCPHMTHASL
eukprot:1140929_1